MKVLPTKQDGETIYGEMTPPCLIPLVEIKEGCEDPAEVYLNLRKEYDTSYLLESLTGPEEESRYSVIGCDSLLHLKIKDGERELNGQPNPVKVSRQKLEEAGEEADELEALKKAMFVDEMQFLSMGLPRYILGITGYVGYDFVRSLEELGSSTVSELNHSTLEFILPSLVMVFDHSENETYYASLIFLTDEMDFDDIYSRSLQELEEFASMKPNKKDISQSEISVRSNIEKEDFEECVNEIKKYIREGDVIQTVLSRRIDLDPSPPLGRFYSELREINPSPYMFFLDFLDQSVVGSSPEALVRVTDGKVMTRPIAGTRPRGKDEEDDKAMEEDLLEDEKERAEHVMLVDLGRNDIGRVSRFGSVEATEFMEVEKYGHVQHIVSTVEGELREDSDSFDALRAVFPAGTVTGAPKIRAMEIIEELEPTRRGIYSGAVGTFSYTGDADFAISIRTLTSSEDKAQIQVGAGIVSDSVPEEEYYETEDKAESLLRAAGVSK